jgi:hypothetical protein
VDRVEPEQGQDIGGPLRDGAGRDAVEVKGNLVWTGGVRYSAH